MRIMVVCPYLPYPPDSGSLLRTYHIVTRLALRHSVHLLCFTHGVQESIFSGQGVKERRFGLADGVAEVQVVAGPGHDRTDPLSVRLQRLINSTPVWVAHNYWPAMRDAFMEMVRRTKPDVIQFETAWSAGHLWSLAEEDVVKVVNLHNVEHDLMRQQLEQNPPGEMLERLRQTRQWLIVRGWEARMLRRADLVLAPSAEDLSLLRVLYRGLRGLVVPNGVVVGGFEEGKGGPGSQIVFTGTLCYPPNEDGVLWFIRDILPLVEERVPNVRFVIVGREPTSALMAAHDGQRVVVTGRVPEVAPYLRNADVAVAPLRAGSGTRIKVLEAMAAGRAVVSTQVGSQGLKVVDGEEIRLADEPRAFADAVSGLLGNADERRRLARQGRRLVKRLYDWDVIVAGLEGSYGQLVTHRAGS